MCSPVTPVQCRHRMELHYWQRRSQALLVHAPAPLRSRRRRGRAGLVKKPPWPRRPARPWARQLVRELGEVEVRGAALDGDRCDVVRPRGHLRVVERASQMRDFLRGSRISDTHLPQDRIRTPRYVGCFRSLRSRFLPPLAVMPLELSPELGDDAFRELLELELLLQVLLSDTRGNDGTCSSSIWRDKRRRRSRCLLASCVLLSRLLLQLWNRSQ
jgi:hypothetical protein